MALLQAVNSVVSHKSLDINLSEVLYAVAKLNWSRNMGSTQIKENLPVNPDILGRTYSYFLEFFI